MADGMKRGEIWTVAAGGGYGGKPRPAVIVQDDRFDATPSVTVCPFTTSEADAHPARLVVRPSEANGLGTESRLMVDKLMTVPRKKLGRRVGALGSDDQRMLDRSMLLFLGLVGSRVPTQASAR
jgi:mRNA interferase MazF